MATTTNYIWDDQNLLAEADGTNTINVVYTNEPEQYGNLVSSRDFGDDELPPLRRPRLDAAIDECCRDGHRHDDL